MRYLTLTTGDANTYLASRRGETPIEIESLVRSKGQGADFDSSFITTLQTAMSALRNAAPDGLKNDKQRNLFEAKAARLVHTLVPNDAEMISDPEFWIWLAAGHFSEIVEWRYDNPEGGTKLANYGIGSRTENLLYRIWLRAELMLDETAADRYHLVDAGQIDFYRSHLFRQGYANARNFARALIKFQYPNADLTSPKLKILEIRELVKRLRRLRSNLFIEILPEEDCRAVIEAEAAIVMVA